MSLLYLKMPFFSQRISPDLKPNSLWKSLKTKEHMYLWLSLKNIEKVEPLITWTPFIYSMAEICIRGCERSNVDLETWTSVNCLFSYHRHQLMSSLSWNKHMNATKKFIHFVFLFICLLGVGPLHLYSKTHIFYDWVSFTIWFSGFLCFTTIFVCSGFQTHPYI